MIADHLPPQSLCKAGEVLRLPRRRKIPRSQSRERHARRYRVSVHAQVAAVVEEGSVEQHVIRTQEFGAADDLDAQTQNGARVNGPWVGVTCAESGDASAGAIQVLLIVDALGGGAIEQILLVTRRCQ